MHITCNGRIFFLSVGKKPDRNEKNEIRICKTRILEEKSLSYFLDKGVFFRSRISIYLPCLLRTS